VALALAYSPEVIRHAKHLDDGLDGEDEESSGRKPTATDSLFALNE